MTAPNIAATANITGKLNTVAVPAAPVYVTVVENPSSSGSVYKINTLYAVNVTGTSATDMHITIVRADSSEYPLIRFTAVPADATLVVVSKDNPIWLEEGDLLKATAGSADRTVIACSYEIIS